jgi:hypothetical protein
MPVTRNVPQLEGTRALHNLVRASVWAAVAQGLYYYAYEIARVLPDAIPKTWRGFLLADIGATVVGGVGFLYLVAGIRRTWRWLIAYRHQRMLGDLEKAALVPPLPSHLQSLDPTKPRQLIQSAVVVAVTFGIVVIMVTLLAFGVVRLDAGEDEFPAFEVLAGALFFLALAVRALWRAWQRYARDRHIQRASRDPVQSAETSRESSAHGALQIPRLVIAAPALPPINGNLQDITVERNVFGRRPWNIAYLRLFDNEKGLQEFLTGAWRECGYVHLIKDADSVSAHEVNAIEGGSRVFINSRSWLLAELDARPAQPLAPGSHQLHHLAAEPVSVSDRYGSYPVRALLCHDSFWKSAVDVLLERADLVVLDLCGYHWNNTGTGYELQRVVDRFPIERCLVLATGGSDAAFVEAQIRGAWSRMSRGSPNEGSQPRSIVVAQGWSGAAERSRALATLIQQRMDEAAAR